MSGKSTYYSTLKNHYAVLPDFAEEASKYDYIVLDFRSNRGGGNGLYFWLPSSSFATSVPQNYLGEGKGYEPDIWANKVNMKSELEKLGLDLADIVFN